MPSQIANVNSIAENSKAFEGVFYELYPSMCVIARNFVQDDAIAEDIAQDAFIKLWNSNEQFEDISRVKAYLYTLVRNLCHNYFRHNKVVEQHYNTISNSDTFNFSNQIIEEEAYRIIHQAVESLPPQSRQIIQLSLKGIQNLEIAEQLGISVNTVKTLKYKALKVLKKELHDYFYVILFLINL